MAETTATRTAENGTSQIVEDARAWLADLAWADDVDFSALTPDQIRRAVSKHYDGGWSGFVNDGSQ